MVTSKVVKRRGCRYSIAQICITYTVTSTADAELCRMRECATCCGAGVCEPMKSRRKVAQIQCEGFSRPEVSIKTKKAVFLFVLKVLQTGCAETGNHGACTTFTRMLAPKAPRCNPEWSLLPSASGPNLGTSIGTAEQHPGSSK